MLDNLRAIIDGEDLPHTSILTFDVWRWAADAQEENDRWFGG